MNNNRKQQFEKAGISDQDISKKPDINFYPVTLDTGHEYAE